MTQRDFGETGKHCHHAAVVRGNKVVPQAGVVFFRAVFMFSESRRQKMRTAVQGAVEGKPAQSNKLERGEKRIFSAVFSSWNEI